MSLLELLITAKKCLAATNAQTNKISTLGQPLPWGQRSWKHESIDKKKWRSFKNFRISVGSWKTFENLWGRYNPCPSFSNWVNIWCNLDNLLGGRGVHRPHTGQPSMQSCFACSDNWISNSFTERFLTHYVLGWFADWGGTCCGFCNWLHNIQFCTGMLLGCRKTCSCSRI